MVLMRHLAGMALVTTSVCTSFLALVSRTRNVQSNHRLSNKNHTHYLPKRAASVARSPKPYDASDPRCACAGLVYTVFGHVVDSTCGTARAPATTKATLGNIICRMHMMVIEAQTYPWSCERC
eukprot:6212969-Pleurochrysis_carterae.AAC.2